MATLAHPVATRCENTPRLAGLARAIVLQRLGGWVAIVNELAIEDAVRPVALMAARPVTEVVVRAATQPEARF